MVGRRGVSCLLVLRTIYSVRVPVRARGVFFEEAKVTPETESFIGSRPLVRCPVRSIPLSGRGRWWSSVLFLSDVV